MDDRQTGSDASAREAVILAAAIALAVAMQVSRSLAFVLLPAAMFLAGTAALRARIPWAIVQGSHRGRLLVRGAVVAAAPLLARGLTRSMPESWPAREVVITLIMVALVALAWASLGERPSSRWYFRGLLATVWVLGLLMVLASNTGIDVRLFQVYASRALFAGSNPFAITFPDLYSAAKSSVFYGPGVSVDGILQFGFPYPPLSLLLIAPGHLIFDDFRIAHLTALVVSAGMIGSLRKDAAARAGGVVLLVITPIWVLVDNGWTEPLVVFLLALTVFGYQRFRSSAPFVFGLLLSVKQYMPIALPAYGKLLPGPVQRRTLVQHAVRILGTVALVTLPFFVIDPGAFWSSVVELQFKQPLRPGALSYLVEFDLRFGSLPDWLLVTIPLTTAGAATVACLRMTPAGARGFALMVAFVLLAWFAFTKQSFENHYLTALGALCIAAAASTERKHRREGTEASDAFSAG